MKMTDNILISESNCRRVRGTRRCMGLVLAMQTGIPRITVGRSVSIPLAVGAVVSRTMILTMMLLVLTLMLSLRSG
jgi:hypothetical protein